MDQPPPRPRPPPGPRAVACPHPAAHTRAGRRAPRPHPGPDDVALLVEVAYASPADDRKLAAEVYGPAGIPVYWIVDVIRRRVEVDTGPGPHGYGLPATFAEGQSVPVVIDGREAGRIAVAHILPPPRPRAEVGGDGARSVRRPTAGGAKGGHRSRKSR